MVRKSPGTELIRTASRLLGPLCEQVVFVGGATLDLHLTDPTAGISRPTDDVDVIVEALSNVEYQKLEAQLRKRGFENDMTSKVICRYRHSGLVLDFMPTDPGILGFGNLWYKEALEKSVGVPELGVRVISAPYFLATKFDAFDSPTREGHRDYLGSRDIADVISVIDGRPEIVDDVAASPARIREHLVLRFADHLQKEPFLESISAHLRPDPESQARDVEILRRMQAIAALG